jgi:hypothetical protein
MERRAARLGVKLSPTLLAFKQTRLYGAELFWIAYWQLRGCTPREQPIPWSEIECWGRANGLDYETRCRAHHLLSSMDTELLKWHSTQKERGEKRSARKGKQGKRRGRR